MEMLNTENALYGFYGTIANDGCADAAWREAMRQGARPRARPRFVMKNISIKTMKYA